MKNKLLIFFGIFIFMILPKNVFAKEIIPVSSIINNQHFSSNSATNNVSVGTTINAGASFTYNIIVTNGSAYEGNNVFLDYPFVIIYFYSNRNDVDNISRLSFSQTSSCNVSCFNNFNISIVPLGTGQYSGNTIYRYAMILPIQKFNSNPDLGDSEVTGSIQFTNNGNNAVYIRMTNVFISDSNTANSNPSLTLDIEDTINQQTTAITNAINTQITNAITASNANYNDFKNTDLSNIDKQDPDTTEYSNYQDAEEDLFDMMDEADINDMDIAIDANSSVWVWGRITDFLGSHSLIMGFLISMLSIGIIKMALGR